ncbi:hypothetical protein AO1008_08860 [Aspergillus oryzae 100-8]|uniref:Berberine/berberine-like domain-containing protein n=1 Tax=Aspergillus oryzae (strain 3.042) TaxID=1160506 RepID=I8TSP6_ASPO3|nr:hypothetical protein Ao3042_06513 [Aspergillus oryzae 3.042]KDE82319.1 hypothetical protein AO1008_08860 [Aspergillus oryzae 100-8]|eukprot:EIT77360.1 hypothetical protein Ao3042_06513 [Aspergillus oryzae 3.042]
MFCRTTGPPRAAIFAQHVSPLPRALLRCLRSSRSSMILIPCLRSSPVDTCPTMASPAFRTGSSSPPRTLTMSSIMQRIRPPSSGRGFLGKMHRRVWTELVGPLLAVVLGVWAWVDICLEISSRPSREVETTSVLSRLIPSRHIQWIISADKTPQVLEAIRDFTENYPDDKAAIIVTAEHAALINTWIMFLFYDGPEPPQGVFDGFKAIGPLDTTKTWDSYYDLLKNNDFFILKGQRYTIATETTPVPNKTVGAEVMQTYYDHWFNITNTVLGVPNMIGSIAFQPMPRTIAQKAQARGGDLINFPTDQDYLVIELDFSYGLSASDEKIDAANKNLFNGFDRIISNYIDEGVLPDVYRPLFMNDANYAQDYWARLGSTEQAREVRKKYDPELFFQKRTSGGFRLG